MYIVFDIYTIYSTVHSERVYIPDKDFFSQGGGLGERSSPLYMRLFVYIDALWYIL